MLKKYCLNAGGKYTLVVDAQTLDYYVRKVSLETGVYNQVGDDPTAELLSNIESMVPRKDGERLPFLHPSEENALRGGDGKPALEVDVLPHAYGAFYPGVYALVSMPGYGKSFFLDHLYHEHDVGLLAAFESPQPGREVSEMAVTEFQFWNAIGSAINETRVIAIDSIQRFVFASDGAAMAGGVSPGLWTALSAWAAVAQMMDRCFIVAMNPLTDDVTKLGPFELAAAGACTGLIRQPVPRKYKMTARYPASAQRQSQDFDLTGVAKAQVGAAQGERADIDASEVSPSLVAKLGLVTASEHGDPRAELIDLGFDNPLDQV
jgi:hypothetical protein